MADACQARNHGDLCIFCFRDWCQDQAAKVLMTPTDYSRYTQIVWSFRNEDTPLDDLQKQLKLSLQSRKYLHLQPFWDVFFRGYIAKTHLEDDPLFLYPMDVCCQLTIVPGFGLLYDSEQEKCIRAHTSKEVDRINALIPARFQLRPIQLTQPIVEDENHPPAPPENPRIPETGHIELPQQVEGDNLRDQEAPPAAQAAAGAPLVWRPYSSRGDGISSSSTLDPLSTLSTLGSFVLDLETKSFPTISHKVTEFTEPYKMPPHPLDSVEVWRANICPVCEKYNVTVLDGTKVSTDYDETTLRARFKCGLCFNVFDLGTSLFDPRGTPGVTLYEGDDRFQPPVAPPGKCPCPRCWSTTHNKFQGMKLFLREDSKVQCQPKCPAKRLRPGALGVPEEKMEMRNAIQAVLGL